MSSTKMSLLGDFLWKNGVDVALLQEVTHNNFDSIRGYTATVNEGIEKRGTAILTRRIIHNQSKTSAVGTWFSGIVHGHMVNKCLRSVRC
jgi:hypothetical protein